MAETVASALLGAIFEKLTDEAFKKIARSHKIHSELNELQSTLSHIQVLLNDASGKEITNESIGQWLNSLQHLAYDIDDILDGVATEAMQREFGQESGGFTRKVRNAIPTWCINLSLSQSLHQKLDSIAMKLQDLEKQKSNLGLVVKDEKQTSNNRGNETSLPEYDVVGREGDREKLMNKLLGGIESYKENFSIVPIVGMGGVGKTTLARLLYNDPQVKCHFKLKAWVCVSDDFEIFRISATILQSVTGENKNFNDLNQIQTALIEQFRETRFLLVFDDVWIEKFDDWENLVRPFHSCAPGSRIIITTRKEPLLKMLGFAHLDHTESLSDRDALSLLALHALGVDNFDSHPTLRSKGEGIVGKCGGLPLALKAIGRLLRTKIDEEDWDTVLNNKIWNLEDCNDIVPALRLSYHDLPSHLKQLFAYCSLFPKDFLFDKEELVLLWMAEGYLNQSQSPEHLGYEYFEKLLSRSFFQYAPNDRSLYVMHDLMNDLATLVASEYCLRFDHQSEIAEEALAKYRHMSFIREKYVGYQKFEAFERAGSLRTLLAVSIEVEQSWKDFYLSNKFLVNLIPRLPLLRVLSLRHFRISEVPNFIGNLRHLRYLNLALTKIKELPENVGNLCNLQTLILLGCKRLVKLPKSFVKLKKLRHFDIRDTPLLKKLPVGIGELRSLHTFTKTIIGDKDGFAITELGGLSNLHGELSIEGLNNVQRVMHACEANLSQRRLSKLELKWRDGSQSGRLEMEVLNNLKPRNDMLKYFNIEFYGGMEFPGWIGHPSFYQLVRVSMRGCRKCKFLPLLGQLPSLKELFIQGMDEVKVIGSELTGTSNVVAFSLLEILGLEDMPRCEVWSTNSEILDRVFPCLQELRIKNCHKLREVSINTLPSLKILDINGCGSGVLRILVRVASSITKLKICSISELTDEVWRGAINDLRAVEELDINSCNDIRYLWESEAHACMTLANIKKLHIWNCENLLSLGEKEDDEDNIGINIRLSLRSLNVMECKSMEHCSLNGNSIEGLSIWDCESLTSVSFIGGVGQKLRSLTIRDCKNLTEKINNASMSILEEAGVIGWTNLKSLIQLSNSIHFTIIFILDCPNIESFPNIQLPNLKWLTIIKCQNLKLFPDIQLPNLSRLAIERCENLKSFPDLQLMNFTSLASLKIVNCPSIDASIPRGCWSPNLLTLEIGGLKKPIAEWGFQNFPSSLVNLSFFNESYVRNFSKLSPLLPSSLKELRIQ